MRAVWALLIASTVLVGCQAPTPTTPEAHDAQASSAASAVPAVKSLNLSIPALSLNEPLIKLYRDDDGVLVPPPVTQPAAVGWYAGGVIPGDLGPALIAGHVSGRPEGATASVPGVFARLDELATGDRVEVTRDGAVFAFEVYRVDTVTKATFPSAEVYGDTEGPELRLVTCGGVFDPTARSYDSNVVAFARLVP